MKKIEKALIFKDYYKKQAGDFSYKLKAILKEKYFLKEVDICNSNEKFQDNDYNIIFCIGGDGTLLLLSKFLKAKNIEIFSINFGKIGFIVEFNKENWEFYFQKYLKNELEIRQRTKLSCKVKRGNKKIFELTALNEFSFSGLFSRIINLDVLLQNSKIDYRCDALIFCSQTGSTGHNLSSGGPIISNSIDCITITPICPLKSFSYPLVVNINCNIKVMISSLNRENIYLIADGNENYLLENDDVACISKYKIRLKLISKGDSFYKMIENKWGTYNLNF